MQKRGKKAQAAMEFLTTYGWAILILLVAIVALASLGVFKGPRTPNVCIATAPIACTDVKVIGNVYTAVMSASGTFSSNPTITVLSLSQPSGISCTIPPVGTIGNGPTQLTCTLTSPLTAGSRFAGEATVRYTPEAGTQHDIKIPFSGTAE